MYGKVSIKLTSGAPTDMRVPSAALVGKAENGEGEVYVVRNGKVEKVKVKYDFDNGMKAEIVSGLQAADQVIVCLSVPVEPGTPVTVLNGTH